MTTPELEFVDGILAEVAEMGIAHVITDDDAYDGRLVTVAGRETVNFGSCSYLGLQHHPSLVEGAIDAVRRYGTQFSSSRAYLSPTLYREVEGLLEEIFGAPTIVTPSTTLAHVAALPVLITREDAAILDRQVHNSAQTASVLAAAQGARVEAVSHNDLEGLAARARELSRSCERVWFLCDGVYSMFGDFAPMQGLMRLVEEIPKLHLYVDDAHGMGWFGSRGQGYALGRAGAHPRVVVATSLSKSFAGSGGALVIADPQLRRLVRNCGGPMTFSGPLPPSALGALAASARLHLSSELATHQEALRQRLDYTTRRARELGLPMVNAPGAPVRFLALGDETVVRDMVRRMRDEGFWTNCAGFPAVPRGRGGLRFTISNTVTFEDIDALLVTMARHLPLSHAECGHNREETEEALGRIRARLNMELAA